MRYETPEIVTVGAAEDVILGLDPDPTQESENSTQRSELVGYDE
jgi:hypothetical protein